VRRSVIALGAALKSSIVAAAALEVPASKVHGTCPGEKEER
jgi:hypothetical protein